MGTRLAVRAAGGTRRRAPRSWWYAVLGALAGVALLVLPAARADTIHVDDDAPNDPGPGDPLVGDPLEDGSAAHPFDAIQEAIHAAVAGDNVVLQDGTYRGAGNRNVDVGSKSITLRSASGDPGTCVIDCESAGRGFTFTGSTQPERQVIGLTITNGRASPGGGIVCTYASPTLRDCVISSSVGGGVHCIGASPTFIGCTITQNHSDMGGGGVYCAPQSQPTLRDCTISENSTLASGGGVYCADSNGVRLAGCVLTRNTADVDGGGLWFRNSGPAVLTDCTISMNRAYGAGGGVGCDFSRPTLTRCTIAENLAGEGGGGIHCRNRSDALLTECTVARNSVTGAYGAGSGLHAFLSGPMLVNCTIEGHSAGYRATVFCEGSTAAQAILANCLFVRNSGPGIVAYGSQALLANCTITKNYANYNGNFSIDAVVTNCIVWDNPPRAQVYGSNVAFSVVQGGAAGIGNIDADPRFVRPPDDGGDGWGDDPDTPDVDEGANDDFGDLRLQPGSPCADAGDSDSVPMDTVDLDGDDDTVEALPVDLAGRARFVDDPFTPDTGIGLPPIVDMGAYEYQVRPACPGDTDCSGERNFFDIDLLLAALGGESAWRARYEQVFGAPPRCDYVAHCDANGDGTVDFFDIDAFLSLLCHACPE